MTGFDKVAFDTHNNQTHFLPLLNSYVCQLANSSHVYWWLKFSSLLFLWLVSGACHMSTSAQVVFKWLWWDLKSSHLAGNCPEICLSHQFGYFLGHLKPKKASGKAIWLSFGFMEVFITTLHPYMEVFVILTVPVL